ncbi:MAG: hypothetical protein AB8C95_10350 [Phycisphaeraceae bacterium]
MTQKKRRRLRILLLLVVVSVLTACILLPDFIGQINAGKYEPVDTDVPRPTGVAALPVAEVQTEPHTCGLHAMRSMYSAYGLNADQYDLRFRLGTDQPAMRVDSETTGTLHPDLYRVLAQDGFTIDLLDLDADIASTALQNHLAWQQLSLALVYRSTYHWVLIGPSESPDKCVIYDSLHAEPIVKSIDTFLQEALSITLVQPAIQEGAISITDAHTEGLAETARLYKRKK